MPTRSELYHKAKDLGWTTRWNRSTKADLLQFLESLETPESKTEIKNNNITNNIDNMSANYQPEILKTKNLILNEKFNAKKLAWVIDNIDEVKNQIIEKDPSRWNDEWNPLPGLKRYYNKNGERKVEYKQKSFGRLFSHIDDKCCGLQSMAREFRHTISSEYYHDLDMKNAHPVILQHLCRKMNIKTPLLDQYIANREEILRKIGSREAGKIQILKLTNGGGRNSDLKNQWLDNYEAEMQYVHNEFSKMDEFKYFEKRNEHNGKAKWVNILLCRYEHILLMTIFDYFNSPTDCVLCFDGIMLTKDTNIDLKVIEKVIHEKHGINMKMAIKPMNDGLVTECKYEKKESKSNADILTLLRSAHTDEDYARCFVKLYSSFIVYEDTVYQYVEKHRWVRGKDTLIYEFLSQTMYKQLRAVLDVEYNSIDHAKQHAEISKSLLKLCNWGSRKGIVASVMAKCEQTTDVFDMNCNLIGFTNGVYDMKEHKFREGRKEDYISMTTGYDYQPRQEAKISILHKFLSSILPDPAIKAFTLKALSTGLWGKTVQNFFICTGEGSNGKDTLISKLYSRTLGSDYFYVADNAIITEKRRNGGPNQGLANMNKKRFILFNEPDKKSLLNGSQIKQFTGVDKINARGLYKTNTETVIHATSAVLCNDIPLIDSIDGGVVRRLCVIPFQSLFKPQEEIKNYENKTNIYPINSYYDSAEFFEENKLTLFHILTDYLRVFQSEGNVIRAKPERIVKLSEQYLDDCDDFTGWLNDKLQPVNDPTKFVKVREIYKKFQDSDFYRNLSKREKRKCNNKNFLQKIKQHNLTRPHYKEEHYPYTSGVKKCFRNVVVNFTFKVYEDSDDEDEDELTPSHLRSVYN
jgi:P4 family phage/plasmid primase-like protien